MKRLPAVLAPALIAIASAGCVMAPRINLDRFGTIGFIGFDTRAEGNIDEYANQVFLEVLLRSQPGTRIIDLGPAATVLRGSRSPVPTPEILADLRSRYNVDAVLTGILDVSKARPRVELGAILLGSIRASVDMDAFMSARLMDTHDGTTFWMDSARVRMDIADLSVLKNGQVMFDARDPERAYGRLVRELVLRTTRDFR